MSPGVFEARASMPSRGRSSQSPGFWARDLPAAPSGLRPGVRDMKSSSDERRRSERSASSSRSHASTLSADSRSNNENPGESTTPRWSLPAVLHTQPMPDTSGGIRDLARANYQRKVAAESRASVHGETNIFAAARLSRKAKTSRSRSAGAAGLGLPHLAG